MPPSRSRTLARTLAVLFASVSVAIALSGCAPVADLVVRNFERGVDHVREEPAQDGYDDADENSDLDETSTTSDDGNTAFEDIEVGDCLNDAEIGTEEEVDEVYSLDVVPCSDPHDSEVYGTFTYPDGDYPTDDQLDELAWESCLGPFEDFVGTDYDSSQLDYSFYTPTRIGWKYGDRDALCELYDMDFAKLTGSARGTGL